MRTLVVFALVLLTSCASVRQMANSLMSLKDMQFRIVRVENMRIVGVDVSRMRSISDVSAMDAVKLLSAFRSKQLTTTFTVYVEARNPNDGGGGGKPADLTLKELPWQLYIDDKPTISGAIRKEVGIPGGQTSAPFPLEIEVDLTKVITDKGYEELVALALSIGGVNSQPTKLMVEATPVVGTPFGVMKSPSPIRIVNTEFRSR
ncbi:MAG: hypothetical protein FGM33_05805 [Candidatus Kapabacteria bacterium]|nr:hypothetical protein [Candidatus Kapabacteria bacterium]